MYEGSSKAVKRGNDANGAACDALDSLRSRTQTHSACTFYIHGQYSDDSYKLNDKLSVTRPNRSASRFPTWALYALLFAYIAVSLAYQVVSSATIITTYFDLRERAQTPFNLASGAVVASVMAPAAHAGLRVGDRIERVDGVPYHALAQLQSAQWHGRIGDFLHLEVRRTNGMRVPLSIPFQARPLQTSASEAGFFVFIQVVIPLFCLGLGYWVALARPLDLNAWLVLLLLSYPESLLSASVWQWWPGLWLGLRLYWHLILLVLAPLALLWLGLRFPRQSRIDIRLPWLKWCASSILFCGLGFALATDYAGWFDRNLLTNRARIDAVNNPVILWTIVFCVIFYWAALFGRSRTALVADARRRLRVLRTGSVVGLGSALVIFGGLPWLGIANAAHIRWLNNLGSILMLVFPLSLAYVVIVQRAMDVRILLRMSSKYLLASATAKVARVAGIAALIWFIAIPLATHHHTPQETALLSAVLLIFGFLFLKRKSPTGLLQQWIDRNSFAKPMTRK